MTNKSENTTPEVKDSKIQNGQDQQLSITDTQVEGPSEADITEFINIAQQLEKELCSVVIGQERVIRELLLALFAGGHVLLEGVPGLGKTLLVRTVADALTLKFARIQFTPDLMPDDIVVATIVSEDGNSTGRRHAFCLLPGSIFANIAL